MKKIVLIGGSGTVGTRIANGLSDKYEIVVMDTKASPNKNCDFIRVDATNFQDLQSNLPKDTSCIINLLKTDTDSPIENIDVFQQMTRVFFESTYYILMVANQFNIPKVIFASSNHVTDYYEEEGNSIFNRDINVSDYPSMKGLYGVLKLASEQLGFIFSNNAKLSVINIRIGSVPPKVSKKDLKENERLTKTLLTDVDLVELFKDAIESTINFGTYYGVSDNPDKPWDTANATIELGFKSMMNSNDIS
ncbi:NAD-dependent epimerase/dehydratase family protein [Aquibacillus rhizosphaerae]|uniref:NAD(P)-dependent oxidoreductase n=1 Tax=Aquibacillus rhizosphaerae TaxID=3051431 RepID=A0ABT7L324_9BACI|nr:NAD(P)-dependent oxidoreductase [Aquibacillus sp. LR5S19]MDL4840267.1 NAD(P)-dependent oxidoreductase [Aquibacillus sp. LR5S19]